MMRKFLFGILGGIIFLAIGFISGLIIGAFIGGNFFPEFEFSGVRGYEAVGNLGAMLGALVGAVFGILMGVMLGGTKKRDKS